MAQEGKSTREGAYGSKAAFLGEIAANTLPQRRLFHYARAIFRANSIILNPFAMGNWEPIWIASLEIPPWIEQKIHIKHGINVEEIRASLVCNSRVLGRVTSNSKDGSRTIVFLEYPIEKYLVAHINLLDDHYSAWSLRTARVASQIPIVRR